jgi:hypothetical protein
MLLSLFGLHYRSSVLWNKQRKPTGVAQLIEIEPETAKKAKCPSEKKLNLPNLL